MNSSKCFCLSVRLLALISVCCFFFMGIFPLRAGIQTEEWTADDILMTERTSGWSFSPDGRFVSWIQEAIDNFPGGEKRIIKLLLTNLTDGITQTLMRGENIILFPAFSPDNSKIAFISNRKPADENIGMMQVWVASLRGEEPIQITRFERGVRNFAWMDSQSLAVLAQEAPALGDKKSSKPEDDSYAAGEVEQDTPIRLFMISIKDGRSKRLTDNNVSIRSLSIDPQGKTALISMDQDTAIPFGQTRSQDVFLVNLTNRNMKKVGLDAALRPNTLSWSLDGKGFYFINLFFRHPKQRWPGVVELHYYD